MNSSRKSRKRVPKKKRKKRKKKKKEKRQTPNADVQSKRSLRIQIPPPSTIDISKENIRTALVNLRILFSLLEDFFPLNINVRLMKELEPTAAST